MSDAVSQPPPALLEILQTAAARSAAHEESPEGGMPELRRVVAAWARRHFGVALDPDEEIVVTAGAKSGLAWLCRAILRAGDWVWLPDFAPEGHRRAVQAAGANVAKGAADARVAIVETGSALDAMPETELLVSDATRRWSQSNLRRPNGIQLHCVGSRFGVPGWGVGFAFGDAALIESLRQAQSVAGALPAIFIQEAAIRAIELEYSL